MYDLKCRPGYEEKEVRFLKLIDKTERCWIWIGGITSNDKKRGYGRVQINKKRIPAHRLSYEIYKGDIVDSNLYVCHTCDNPKCVNPDHLFLGSNLANIADCIIKGRHTKGENQGSHKLTENDVREMRRLYSSGEFTQQELAHKYGIDRPYATKIINYRQWKHVKNE